MKDFSLPLKCYNTYSFDAQPCIQVYDLMLPVTFSRGMKRKYSVEVLREESKLSSVNAHIISVLQGVHRGVGNYSDPIR